MITSTAAPATPARPQARPVPPRRLAIRRVLGALGRRAERGFTLAALFVYSQAVVPLLLTGGGGDTDLGDGHPVLRRITASVTVGVLLLCAVRWREWGHAARREGWALALVGLALASTLWSGFPEVTLRRAMVLVGSTAFGVYLATRHHPASLLRLLALLLGTEAVLSAVFALALPSLGRDTTLHVGAWQGVFTQKNTLGVTMVIGTLSCLLVWRDATRRRWIPAAGAALAALVLVMSTSKTALVILGTLVAVLPLYSLLRSRHSAAIPLLIFAVLTTGTLATVLLLNREAVLVALGRDVTLTGRTDLWAAAARAAEGRAWLGHGYSAFWTGEAGPSRALWSRVGWEPPNSHNGYLDVWLDLGLVGLGLLAAGILAGVTRAVRMLRDSPAPAALWPLAYLTFMLLYNLTESLVLKQNSLFWVLYVTSVTMVALHGRAKEER